MKRSTRSENSSAYGIAALIIMTGLNAGRLCAQEVDSSRDDASVATSSVRSLDDVRDLNAKEESMIRVGMPLPPEPSAMPSNTAAKRQIALTKVREIQGAIAGEGDRKQMEKKLRDALNDFFLADMQYRVEEL
ncbi:MAG: hypothetical protein AAF745_19640, partial [Planctomycetota bacterium]